MIAQVAGLLTIILAVWTWRVEKRRWLRFLGLAALGTVVAQGVLGGMTVLFYLPPAVSSAHAALAQTFFCIAVAIALFTGSKWVEEQPRVEFDPRKPSLFTLTLLSIFVLYVQLVLGAMYRHHGLSWWPHVVHAGIVSFVLAWTGVLDGKRVATHWRYCPRLQDSFPNIRVEPDAIFVKDGRVWSSAGVSAVIMLSLVIAQLCLGFTAFLTRVAWGKDAAQPELPMVISTVSHVAVGALLLATTVILSIQVWRHVPVAFEERVPQAQRDPSAA